MDKLGISIARSNARRVVEWLWFAGWLMAFVFADNALSNRWPDTYGQTHLLAGLACVYLAFALIVAVVRRLLATNS